MSLKTEEDAKEYLTSVRYYLNKLTELSKDAGLYKQAGMWVGIESAFMGSVDDIDTVTNIIHMFIESKIRELELKVEEDFEKIGA